MFCAPASALQIFKTGNLNDFVTTTKPAVCLAGGGSDDGWAQGWNYLLQQSRGGDIVIIRTDHERGGYESWIYNDDDHHGFPKVNSVTTLSIDGPSDVDHPEVIAAILHAELIFFAGGDQNTYVQWFLNSRLTKAINYMTYVKKVPIGGTSAGMALLAGIDYTGKYPSPRDHQSNVSSGDVLQDPTGYFVDLDQRVITAPFLENVITETHFSQRSRQGRIVGFMARAIYNHYTDIDFKNIKGIAADEETAVCYDQMGAAKIYGQGSVFFLRGLTSPERIQDGRSLDWDSDGQAVSTYVISAKNHGATFDLKLWTGFGGRQEFWSVDGQNEDVPILIRH
ncbi:MAG: cyanophycinase [Bdellovibrio sp.]|nr:cyanophycinase [Bdellovibrio sp.]